MKAVETRQRAETITSVLYPSDSTYNGKELRLKQQYFFVCATIADIMFRFKSAAGWHWDQFAEKNAIQLNDTHPAIGIAELMRVLVDEEGLEWDAAWRITQVRGTCRGSRWGINRLLIPNRPARRRQLAERLLSSVALAIGL